MLSKLAAAKSFCKYLVGVKEVVICRVGLHTSETHTYLVEPISPMALSESAKFDPLETHSDLQLRIIMH